MSKKNKIIISIIGITIVLLALLGLTYAYYLTRIEGNTNTNSISVTTAKLELIYGDGNGILLPYGTIEPNSDESIKFYKTDASGNPITNEPPVDNKTFTVTNNGNDSNYVVIIDEVSIKKASDGTSTTFVSNDFRYTLSCVVKDKSGNVLSGETCNQQNDLTIFPIKGGILVGNDIPENKVHEYTFKLWYIDTGVDQSDDMGKSLQARINITDVNQMENPFKTGVSATDNASLAYNIIKNAKDNKNGTRFVNTPPSKVAEQISSNNWDLGVEEIVYYDDEYVVGYAESEDILRSCYFEGENCDAVTDYTSCTNEVKGKYVFDQNEGVTQYVTDCENGKIVTGTVKYEKVLSTTQDNYGTSYYFRGNVEDNYVTFNNMCWRIVRIQGDGSIKLTLESQSVCSEDMESNFSIGFANWGYYKNATNKYIGDYKNSTSGMKNLLTTWFDTNFKSDGNLTNAGLKIKNEEWCLSSNDKVYTRSGSSPNYIYTLLENPTYTSTFYYDSYVRLYGNVTKEPTLKCNGEKDISKIGALTADEVVYAGGKAYEENYNYYLQNNNYYIWWTLSRSYFNGSYDGAFYGGNDGDLNVSDCVGYNDDVRPAVSLNTGVKIIEGVGTKKNPYIINEG